MRFVQSDGAREVPPARAMEGSNDQHGFADSIRAAERHGSRDNDRRCARSDNCMGYANRACKVVDEPLKARQSRLRGQW
ncbi:hypothetical protein C2L65_36785 [Paraburkholderia terrae]|uniref:Uncharacterized protein n=1 Tax=Paraburkholderia terrae TaxID=311230 RepID=A0A2I8F035_9BURK|nr:hypothetical protein C2L65_36785 [Paraburkholderia terrae]